MFQLVSFHMCTNGMLCAMLEPKRHLRVLARAAHPALQDLILEDSLSSRIAEALQVYVCLICGLVFRRIAWAICHSAFSYEFDDPYVGKSKAERKYSRNATVPGLVMRPVEHVLGAG